MSAKALAACGLLGILALSAPRAEAVTLSAGGGLSLAGGEAQNGLGSASLLLSGEITWGVGEIFQLGAFYDHNSFGSDEEGAPAIPTRFPETGVSFYGLVGRFGLGTSNVFVDGKLGWANSTGSGGGVTFDSTRLTYGIGAGLVWPVGPILSIKPRVGYRSLPLELLPTSYSRSSVDLGVLVSLGL